MNGTGIELWGLPLIGSMMSCLFYYQTSGCCGDGGIGGGGFLGDGDQSWGSCWSRMWVKGVAAEQQLRLANEHRLGAWEN